MEIRDITNYDELKLCVNLVIYQTEDPLFPVDERFALSNMNLLMRSKCLFKVILIDNKVVGWGCAKIGQPHLFSREKEVSLIYYQTILKGILAVKALKLFHKEMIVYALANKIQKCSTSSIMDTQETFYRILEKEGWIRRGASMLYVLDNRETIVIQRGAAGRQGPVREGTALTRGGAARNFGPIPTRKDPHGLVCHPGPLCNTDNTI